MENGLKDKRFLVLAHNYADNNANTLRSRKIVNTLIEQGAEVDIIGARKLSNDFPIGNVNYYSLVNTLNFKSFFSILFTIITKGLFEFKHLRFYKGFKNDLIWAALAKYEITKLLKTKKYDISLISVVPWTYYTFSKRLSQNSSVVIDISDPLYKNAFTNVNGKRELIEFEKNALSFAQKIVVVSEPLLDLYIDEMGINAEKMQFISPSTDTSNYHIGERHNYKLADNLTLLYAGSIYPHYRDVEQLIPIVQNDKTINLTLISNRPEKSNFNNINYSNWIPKEQLINLYKQTDIIVFIDNFYGYQIPSKIFEIIVLQKPVLFIYDERNIYLYKLLKGQKGIFFTLNNRVSIKESIEHIKSLKYIEVEFTIDLNLYSDKYMCEQMINIFQNAIS